MVNPIKATKKCHIHIFMDMTFLCQDYVEGLVNNKEFSHTSEDLRVLCGARSRIPLMLYKNKRFDKKILAQVGKAHDFLYIWIVAE